SNRRRAAALARRLRGAGVDLDDPGNVLLHDGPTLLHWNHIRDGARGGWRRQATPRQLAVLAALCTDWLVARRYQWDDSWAERALAGRPETAAAARRDLEDAQGELNRTLRRLGDAEEGRARALGELEETRERLRVTGDRLRTAEDELGAARPRLAAGERA